MELELRPSGAQPAEPAPADEIPPIDGAVVKDSKGRKITLRELGFLAESRIVRLVGGENSDNNVFLQGYAIPAAMVAAIDGQPWRLPNSFRELEAAIDRLGHAGATAILSFSLERAAAMAKQAEARAAADGRQPSAEDAAVKNS